MEGNGLRGGRLQTLVPAGSALPPMCTVGDVEAFAACHSNAECMEALGVSPRAWRRRKSAMAAAVEADPGVRDQYWSAWIAQDALLEPFAASRRSRRLKERQGQGELPGIEADEGPLDG